MGVDRVGHQARRPARSPICRATARRSSAGSALPERLDRGDIGLARRALASMMRAWPVAARCRSGTGRSASACPRCCFGCGITSSISASEPTSGFSQTTCLPARAPPRPGRNAGPAACRCRRCRYRRIASSSSQRGRAPGCRTRRPICASAARRSRSHSARTSNLSGMRQ